VVGGWEERREGGRKIKLEEAPLLDAPCVHASLSLSFSLSMHWERGVFAADEVFSET